jgi:PAS domain S-box-containing protein
MDVHPEDFTEEIKHLRRCVNDLVSVLALPAMWSGGEQSQIVYALLDALLRMLQLDLVYVRLKETGDQPAIEMVRLAQPQKQMAPSEEIGDPFKQWRGTAPQEWPRLVRNPFGDRDISIFPLGLGLQGEIGVLVAGADRADFPQQTERLILSVAANQASIGLQEAWRRTEQKQVAGDLDRQVAQRTTELAATNEKLRKEIADRKHAEEGLRSSEEKHRVILEVANDAVISMDEKGFIVFANPATKRIFGYNPEEVIGKPMTILMPESMRELHTAGLNRYLSTGRRHIDWQGTELTARRKNSEEFPVEVSFGELNSASHRLFTGFIRDISERKRAETALRVAMDERTRLSAFRAEIGMALAQQKDLKGILRNCAGAVVRHLDAAFARIWTLSGDGRELELQASAGMYTRLDGPHSRIPVGQHKIGLIAQERRPHFTNDAQNDPRVSDKDWARREKMISFAGYPLVLENRLVGVMGMFSQKALPESTLEALSFASGTIAQGIERKRAEEALRRSEALLAEGQRLGQIGSYSWRVATDEIKWSNELYCIYEFEIGTPVTRELIRSRVHPEDVSLIEKMNIVDRAGEGGHGFEWRYRLLMPDHSIKYLHAVTHATRDQDGQLEYIASVQDVTAHRLAEEARSELAHAARVISLGTLTASIAHEVNQPLTAITNNGNACLRLLANRNLEPDVLRGALEEIVADGARASGIITRIRSFLKKKPAEKNALDMNEVIHETVALAGRELSENRVRIEYQLTQPLPSVLADRVQMQQVLLNLIMNAIEAMMGTNDLPRLLNLDSGIDESGNVMVAVRDSGVGLGSDLSNVFTPFYTTKANGMGMGLSISRSLVEGLGGHLRAAPNSPRGSVFSFTLPVANGGR